MTGNYEQRRFSRDGVSGTISWTPAFQDQRNERMLLGYDATGERDYPETGYFGYLYVFGLSNDWIKVGRTGYWDKRCWELAKRFTAYGLSIEEVWKTEALPMDALIEAENRVLAYARSIADPTRLFYTRGRGSSEDTEMFHGAGFGAVRAYADVIARCEAVADERSSA